MAIEDLPQENFDDIPAIRGSFNKAQAVPVKRRTYLIYVTERGGPVKFGDPERYEEVVRTGMLDVTPPWDDGPSRDFVEPKYIALIEVIDDYDFVIGTRARRTGVTPARSASGGAPTGWSPVGA